MKPYKYLDYFLPVLIWFLIFGKNISNLMFVDFTPSTFFDFTKFLVMNNFIYAPYFSELIRLILYFLNLLPAFFAISILIAMTVSYIFIKKLFKEKERLYPMLFALIFFFNPFVYSRIMIGQLYHLISYLLLPVLLFYIFNLLKNRNKNSLINLIIAFTICSSFSPHFFAINLLILLISFAFFLPKLRETALLSKYLLMLILVLSLIILLNSFWIQGFFSNKIFSVINDQHEDFFSPKMSKDVSAVAKIIGVWGFWREAGYVTTYKQIPVYLWYFMLALLLMFFLIGYYLVNDRESKIIFTLFWIGLVFGTGISHPFTKPFFDFLFNNLPFFNGFRDSHKLVSLIALAYAYFIPLTIIEIKNKIKYLYRFIIIFALVLFIIAYTYPLIGLHNQIKSINYPPSYYQINNYLEKQSAEGYIIYLPWQNYLTYSWSLNSSSDGRITIPINNIVKKIVLIGADRYGIENEIVHNITSCLSQKSQQCLENANVQFILNDKCALYFDKYEWMDSQSSMQKVYSTECIDIYKLKAKTSLRNNIIPLRFFIGIFITIITLIGLIVWRTKKSDFWHQEFFVISTEINFRKFFP